MCPKLILRGQKFVVSYELIQCGGGDTPVLFVTMQLLLLYDV